MAVQSPQRFSLLSIFASLRLYVIYISPILSYKSVNLLKRNLHTGCERSTASVLLVTAFDILFSFSLLAEVRGITNRKTVIEGYESVQAALLDYTLTCYPSVTVSSDEINRRKIIDNKIFYSLYAG